MQYILLLTVPKNNLKMNIQLPDKYGHIMFMKCENFCVIFPQITSHLKTKLLVVLDHDRQESCGFTLPWKTLHKTCHHIEMESCY